MVGQWFRTLASRLRAALGRALREEHTPHEVAASFSLGTFITMLPTLGTGLISFVFLVSLTDRLSKIALFASVLVFNPVVKWGVYALSFTIGVFLLGPVDGVSPSNVSLSSGSDIVTRLLVGNVILALLVMPISYVAAYRVAVRMSASDLSEKLEDAVEGFVEDPLAR